MSELLAVVSGIHQTLSVEQKLSERGIRVALVPTPPVVRAGCGFSILVSATADRAIPSWWIELGLPGVLYRVVLAEGRKRYEEIDRREGAGVPPAGDRVPKGDDGTRSR